MFPSCGGPVEEGRPAAIRRGLSGSRYDRPGPSPASVSGGGHFRDGRGLLFRNASASSASAPGLRRDPGSAGGSFRDPGPRSPSSSARPRRPAASSRPPGTSSAPSRHAPRRLFAPALDLWSAGSISTGNARTAFSSETASSGLPCARSVSATWVMLMATAGWCSPSTLLLMARALRKSGSASPGRPLSSEDPGQVVPVDRHGRVPVPERLAVDGEGLAVKPLRLVEPPGCCAARGPGC